MSRVSTALPPEPANAFTSARDLAASDMHAVDRMIRQRLHSDVVLINAIGEHIVGGGGKRLRPMLHVLAAHAAGYGGNAHIELAAVIEFIHTATLLHDDVVDESDLRRGRKSANAAWGNAASVLVGDFLYSRAFQMMVELDRMQVMRILADTTNSIAEGEVLQLLNIGKAETDEAAYMRVIERKTAVLFAAAAELGGVLAGRPEREVEALRRYGMQLGCAFQIADDLLDYCSDTDTLGKHIGDDLAEGKPTLPLIYAIQRSTPMQAELLRNAITSRRLAALDVITAAIRDCGALERTHKRAQAHADAAQKALTEIRPSAYRDALMGLADYAVNRPA